MKGRLASTLVLAAALAASLQADVQGEMQKIYDGFSAAFAKNDPAPFSKALAADYVLVVPGRPDQNRKSVLEDFKKQMANMHHSKWQRIVRNVERHGDSFLVIVKSHFSGEFDHQGHHKFENDAVTEDTWSKVSGGWQLHKSKLVSMSASVDGKSAGKI